jgi:putative transposase
MTEAPEDHRRTSVHANLGKQSAPFVTPHDVFLSMAPDPIHRAATYQAWLRAGVRDDDLQRIREHLRKERVLGSSRFQAMAEEALGRPA